MTIQGWFADIDKDRDGFDERFPWSIWFQYDGGVFGIEDVFFQSESDALGFIEEHIIGRGLLEPREPAPNAIGGSAGESR